MRIWRREQTKQLMAKAEMMKRQETAKLNNLRMYDVTCNLELNLTLGDHQKAMAQSECGRKFKNTEENVEEEESDLKKWKRNLGEYGSILKTTKLFEFSKCVNSPKSQDHLVITIFLLF